MDAFVIYLKNLWPAADRVIFNTRGEEALVGDRAGEVTCSKILKR